VRSGRAIARVNCATCCGNLRIANRRPGTDWAHLGKSQAWHRLVAVRPVLQFHKPSFRNHRSLEIFSAKALISSKDFVPAALFICRRMMIAPFRAMMR
jgi:hypothetical protein